MSIPSKKPSDSDREFLQAELTRLVGQGRLDLNTYQDLVDIVWSTDNNSDLMQIRARYFSGPPIPPPQFGNPAAPQPHLQQPPIRPQQPFHPHAQPQQPQPPIHYTQQPHPHPHPHAPQGIPMGGHLSQPQQFSPQPANQPEQSTMGTIKKTGEWAVPAYSAYKLNGSDLHIDLRKATAAAPVVTIDITMNMSATTLVVPPGVHVDVQIANKNWSEFHVDTSAPIPGAPRVVLTGVSRASTLKVITKSPNEPLGFWEQMFGGR
ncbi:DUF1707 domain-containing protein [uncultured Corynebacterium sp.]|uniref:DUF1707 domain-containing protein n=1 Tax=uncultured Corynebacterium sp. TaxID=159447 RepID=UPI0025DFB607|nr:DUF1707 domain-containing protein [uncultured Corynebacterium sp.]